MKLYDSSIGAIFSIPDTTWQLVTYRVGGTLIAREAGIDKRLPDQMPGFAHLADQCGSWHNYTFNALLRFIPLMGRFAAQMAEELSVLQCTVSGLDRAAPLPPAHAQVIRNTMAALERPAHQVAMHAAALAPQLSAFVAAGLPVGLAAQRMKAQLNAIPDFATTALLLQHLDDGLRDGINIAADAWTRIAADLGAVATSGAPDWRLLAGPDIAAAIAGWKRLHAQANTFSSRIQDWTCPEFMSGSWITCSMPAASVFTANDPLGLFGQYLMLSTGRTPPYQLPLVQETQGLPLAVTPD